MTPAQLLDRKRYIGSSESAAACGLSPWKTPFELWTDKTSAIVIEADNTRMEWGRRLEAVILAKYAEGTEEEVETPCLPVVHPDYPWMRATPDGLTPTRVVEVKTAGLGQAREWGEAGDAIPLPYLLQVTHLMLCTRRRLADVAVLIAGNDFRTYSIALDEELAGLLIERERDFWQHVQDGTPPEVKSISDAVARWPKDSGITAIATREIADAVVKLREVNAQRDALEADADALSLAIRTCMAEASVLTDSAGTTLATWKAQQRTQFEYAEFKRAHPDLYEQFSTKHSSRVFRLSKGKA